MEDCTAGCTTNCTTPSPVGSWRGDEKTEQLIDDLVATAASAMGVTSHVKRVDPSKAARYLKATHDKDILESLR